MRLIHRSRREEYDDDSIFVPMTDMTVSFLFIVMILLAFFAVQFSDEDNIPRSVYEKVLDERNEFERTVARLRVEIDKLNVIIKELKFENAALMRDEVDNLKKQLSDYNKGDR